MSMVKPSQPVNGQAEEPRRGFWARLVEFFACNYNGFSLGALFRIFFVFAGVLLFFATLGGVLYEGFNPQEAAQRLRETSPPMRGFPDFVLVFVVLLISPPVLRFMVAPLAAMLIVIGAAAGYVQIMYGIRRFDQALWYVLASLFAIGLPSLEVDGGKKQVPKGETNAVDVIGGPGFALLQPGNASLHRCLGEEETIPRGLTVSDRRKIFLARFEQVLGAASLEDQSVSVPEFQTMTKDGIQVRVNGLTFRFRIHSEPVQGRPVRRTQAAPFPYTRAAMIRVVYGQSVNAEGVTDWERSVTNLVRSSVSDFINANTIDHLTAPRRSGVDPRRELRRFVLHHSQRPLMYVGAQLLWMDVGHIDIIPGEVDESRINLWAAEWVGDSQVVEAYSEAKRQAYQEQGRAEGQAELIMSIASALQGVDLSDDKRKNLRSILLVRVAQILDSMSLSKHAPDAREDEGRQKRNQV